MQNRQGYAWSLEEVRARLAEVMTAAFESMWRVHEAEGHSLRSAAYTVAMRRIADAMESHGTREYFQNGS